MQGTRDLYFNIEQTSAFQAKPSSIYDPGLSISADHLVVSQVTIHMPAMATYALQAAATETISTQEWLL